MDSSEDQLMKILMQELSKEEANKFSSAELKFLLDKGFDDRKALRMATLDQLEEPPGGRGGLRSGRANMLLAAFGTGAKTIELQPSRISSPSP